MNTKHFSKKHEELKNIHDFIEGLKDYHSGKWVSFDRYDALRKGKRV